MTPEEKLAEMGLSLPPAMTPPPGIVLLFPFISVRGDAAYISGHGPQDANGELAGPFGKVGADVGVEDAAILAQKTALAMLGSLKRELGELSRVNGWRKIFGMVNSAPDFGMQPAVINGASRLILDVFGDEIGRHTRSAVGMAALPFNMAVEIEGEVEIRS